METTIWVCTFIIVATLVGGFFILNGTLTGIEMTLENIRKKGVGILGPFEYKEEA